MKRPNVRKFKGKSTSENIGFMITEIINRPPTKYKRFFGSLPKDIVGTNRNAV